MIDSSNLYKESKLREADTLLQLQDLHINFETREGVVQALCGVNLDIHSNEVLGLVGESGCGKTVTTQAILDILPEPGKITQGSVHFSKALLPSGIEKSVVDIAKLKHTERRRIIRGIRRSQLSAIFQEPMSAMSPVHTIGNQILEAVKLRSPKLNYAEAAEQAEEMLNRVGISNPQGFMQSYTFQVSGGMIQRAMIAMALVGNPKLLIADEPTTAVDVTIQAQILELLKKLRQQLSMSILLITHDLGVASTMAERIAVMYYGRIVEIAPVKEAFHAPKHPYTEGLIKSIPRITDDKSKKLWTIKGSVPGPYSRVSGCVFHPRCHKFKPGICDITVPEEINLSKDHKVSCILYR